MFITLLHLLWFLALLGGGLLVPGWLLGRALGTPGGPAGALLGSAALLTNLLLLLDALGGSLNAPHLAVALAVLCGGLAVIACLRADPSVGTAVPPNRPPWRWQPWHWLLLPAGIGLLAIMVRVGLDPLSGWDCFFRWDFLARQIVRTGSLGFYPTFTADDYRYYGWCDGIAPLVSSLYAWSYFSLGRMETWATTPVVLSQGLLIFYLVGRLAAARSGPAGGAAACALLATSSGVLWSVAMGQETGLTALCTLAMFWFIEQGRTDFRPGWMVWAGLAAGTGALAREYGLILIPLGALALGWWRIPRRGWLAFLVTAAAVALPWYLRNWIKTGNPLYCLKVGNLFPTNPVYLGWLRGLAETNGIMAHAAVVIPVLAMLFGLLAGVPLVIGLAAGLIRWRTTGPWLAALFVFVGLWLWSISHTAGGNIYATRVLTPAIALGAVLGGIGLARLAAGRRAWILAVVLALVAVDAGERSLFLPIYARPAWWRLRFLAWREFAELTDIWRASPRWNAIAKAAEGRSILVSEPIADRILYDCGAHPVSVFSPEVRFLFASATGLKGGTARLRAAGYRFILITRGSSSDDGVLYAHPFFVALAATAPIWSDPSFFLYDLYPAEQRLSAPAPSGHAP